MHILKVQIPHLLAAVQNHASSVHFADILL